MTRRLTRTDYVSGIAAATMIAVIGIRACNKPAPDHLPQSPAAAVAAPRKNDMICDVRFGEENPRSANFDPASCGYCGDGVQQISSPTPNTPSSAIRVGAITRDSKAADQQTVSYNSRRETTDGRNQLVGGTTYHTDYCPIDTALRGNRVCDRNTGDRLNNPTFVYSGYRVDASGNFQMYASTEVYREGDRELSVVRIPVDESARYLDRTGMPIPNATQMPAGGRENPFYAPQDCPVAEPVVRAPPPPAPSRPTAAPSEHLEACRTVLSGEVYGGINSRANPIFMDQRETWRQGASEDNPTYTVTIVISSGSNGNMTASRGRCSGPSDCSPDLDSLNSRLTSLTGTPNVRCVWSNRY